MIKWIVIAIVAAAILLVIAGQLGFYRGSAPLDLGVTDGKLKPPSGTTNSVSSQAGLYADHPMREAASVAPIRYAGDGAAALARLRAVVEAMDRAKIVRSEPLYLHAEFTSKWFKFVDDVEFLVDESAGVMHVRAAARLGQKDFGVNRARVEMIRARFWGGS
ncbi:MAG: DUF1499 domain-containing protein [Betaproteobacteria bacterium]|nr:DUF1499 domain-containing protein [Betaproteobacteria bacterium]